MRRLPVLTLERTRLYEHSISGVSRDKGSSQHPKSSSPPVSRSNTVNFIIWNLVSQGEKKKTQGNSREKHDIPRRQFKFMPTPRRVIA